MSCGKLYMMECCPPVRAVLMTEKLLGIHIEKVKLDVIVNKDQLKPDYLKVNHQGTVPYYIDDDGTEIADSQAIMIYLVSKYGRNDALYPKDMVKRARVNYFLFYNSYDVFPLLRFIVKAIFNQNAKGPSAQQIATANATYEILNTFLCENKWIAGDQLTIADICLIANVTSLNTLCPIQPKNGALFTWIQRCQKLPCYEVNVAGLEVFKTFKKD